MMEFVLKTGQNVAGTGRWYDAYGGRCSGRQAPYGFWCSWENPRSQLPSDPQTPCVYMRFFCIYMPATDRSLFLSLSLSLSL